MAQEQAIAALEEEVQALKDARLEERFCWILVSIIFFNMAIFARACRHLGDSHAAETSIHRRSANRELTDAPPCPS